MVYSFMRDRFHPTVHAVRPHHMARLIMVLAFTLMAGWNLSATAAEPDRPGNQADLFRSFTQHIQRQINQDKIAFTQASGCINWFYHQQKHPAPPTAQPIRFDLVLEAPSREECLRVYPRGLDSVRQDFDRTQTSLSVSLTFYEYALVGDRNDDRRYSGEELRDLFLALHLSYDPSRSPLTLASSLTARFDEWYRARNLELLMNGMAQLYDKGYRVSPADRAELDRVTK